MDDTQLQRYARHILLEDIGIEGQERILAAHALVIGAGGLGSPVALYLACAGVGHITLVDHDSVDLTNLQRQIAHRSSSVGQSKVSSAASSMAERNPDVQIDGLCARADAALLEQLVPRADVVLDCSDNFSTRQAINRACVQHAKPLVAGAAIGFDGQVSVYDSRQAQAPYYACIFPPEQPPTEAQCATLGVFAPLVGIIGAVQAAEALKLICGVGTSLAARLLLLDGRAMAWSDIALARAPECSVCATAIRPSA